MSTFTLLIITTCLLALLPGLCLAVADKDIPHIQKSDTGEFILYLPVKMSKILGEFGPDFNVRRMADYEKWYVELLEYDQFSAPFAVIGDFNGDGTLDVVMDGDNKEHNRTIALISKDGSFEVIAVLDGMPHLSNNRDATTSIVISKASSGTYAGPYSDEALDLKNDGFARSVVDKGISSVYYYEHGEYKSFSTGD